MHHGNKSCGQPDCVAGKEEGDRHKSDQGVDQLRRDHRQLGLERARVKHLKYIFSRLLSNVLCGENLVGRHDPSCPEEIQNQLVHPVVGIGSQVPIGDQLFICNVRCMWSM